ncbi:uroporphyrinogen-III synthase [Vibrio fluvialis]|uniref:uroporphyrinogen-III synthase n=1 Tax=Vibrio fluvialis TaxID=676 RepID=UPI00192A9176|nr:uroporphyrinogen-III synthase [Vibrio fluvialis]MBL4297355.1 uroporphyrinogen-III synthase [Vibrio fluvialis]
MAVLVTRPDAQGLELCQQLTQLGIDALHHPLIAIEAGADLPLLLPELYHCDILIAVSQHAVTFTHQFLQSERSLWPTSAIYLAVGQKTAHVLSKLSAQPVHYPDISDSEHLLALPELHSVQGKSITILRGNGGRELIFDTLVERGARVCYREVYQRVDLPFAGDVCVAAWQQAGVDTLVITSSHQLMFFVSQLTASSLSWVLGLKLLVPSDRIAHDAKALGFQTIVTTGSAANPDLVAALQP